MGKERKGGTRGRRASSSRARTERDQPAQRAMDADDIHNVADKSVLHTWKPDPSVAAAIEADQAALDEAEDAQASATTADESPAVDDSQTFDEGQRT